MNAPPTRFGRRKLLSQLANALVDSAGRTLGPAEPFHEWPRPPGALDEPDFLAKCTRCDACVDACPHQAIGKLPKSAGGAAGTPAMNVVARPCHLCEDLPCITACEPAALEPIAVAELYFGEAQIDKSRCFTFMGPECGACNVCPPTMPEGAALTFSLGKPQIDTELCTGCGLCRDACPVYGKAITIEPRGGRPQRPRRSQPEA